MNESTSPKRLKEDMSVILDRVRLREIPPMFSISMEGMDVKSKILSEMTDVCASVRTTVDNHEE